ncbi:Uncharacterized protein Rs2_31339 [Raphanus sativus]|nr:Uncharacterized protein Rs2_31339 [Raphanus sativus]
MARKVVVDVSVCSCPSTLSNISFIYILNAKLFLGSPSACSVPINKSELYHKEDRIKKKNLNRILEINKSESYTNSTDARAKCSLFLEVFQHVLCQSTNLNCTNSTDAKAKCADYSPRNISSFVNLTTSGYHS